MPALAAPHSGVLPTPRESGRLLLGEYDVVRVIATGGMGTVFEVRARSTGVAYAAKRIHKPRDPTARDRFRREAELLARCDRHPGIVKVHAYGEDADGAPCMILDLVRGEGLDALLARERRLPPRRAAEIASDIAVALAFVHERGIVHRDVKPSNILLENGRSPRLTDFGLATAHDVERLTRTGVFVGTLDYVAPEQASGATEVGSSSDVFSLGAVLFHLLGGETPIAADNAVAMLAQLHDETRLRDVRDLAPEVPEPLAAIVGRALEKRPSDRYRNGGELAQDLERFLTGQVVRASGFAGRASRARRRRTLRALGAGVAALGLVVLAGVGIARTNARSRLLAELDGSVARARALGQKLGASHDVAPALRIEVEHARASLEAASAIGSATLASRQESLDGLTGDLAILDAERELARGDAPRAIALLDAAPRPSDLATEANLTRARALVAVGRTAEAITLLESPAVETGAEGREVLGDALTESGEWVRAEAAYTRALEASSRHASEIRAKRCGVAALAGDTSRASAELTLLLPDRDLAGLAETRPANAKLAPLAPALYARALGPSASTRQREADLEAAYRLADPPPPLRKGIVTLYSELARARTSGTTGSFISKTITDEELDRLRAAFRFLHRARALDGTVDLSDLWEQLRGLGLWAHTVGSEVVSHVVSRFLVDWPDQPALLYMLASSKRGGEETRSLMLRAFNAIPSDVNPSSHPEELRLVASILYAYATASETDLTERDLEKVRAIAVRIDRGEGWLAVADLERRLGRAREGLEDLDRAEHAQSADDPKTLQRRLTTVRMGVLLLDNRSDEALALATAYHKDHPDDDTGAVQIVHMLSKKHRYQEAVDFALPLSAKSKDDTLQSFLAVALIEVGRLDEALVVADRLQSLGFPDAEKVVRRLVAAARKPEPK